MHFLKNLGVFVILQQTIVPFKFGYKWKITKVPSPTVVQIFIRDPRFVLKLKITEANQSNVKSQGSLRLKIYARKQIMLLI